MIRLSKMADYAIVLLTYVAKSEDDGLCTARSLSERSGLPLPTVSKVLKNMARAELVVAHRGKKGGYSLARPAAQISVAEMITAVDGPIALTECGSHAPSLCEIEPTCPVRSNWATITATVRRALADLTLEQMSRPALECNITRIGQPKNTLELIR